MRGLLWWWRRVGAAGGARGALVGAVRMGTVRMGTVLVGAALGGAVLVGAVALAGCTAAPGPVASASVVVAPTLSAPMASPTRPALWADSGEQGAGAAGVWFLTQLYPYVRETNDTTQWQALSTSECEFCQSTLEDVAADAEAGQVVREGRITATVTRVEELNPLAYSVLVEVDQPAGELLRLDGTKLADLDASHGQVLLVLRREGPDWLLRAAQFFESGVSVPTAGGTP